MQLVFSPLFSMPRIESINFYQNRPKIKLFLPKNTNFLSAGGSAPKNLNQPLHCRFLTKPGAKTMHYAVPLILRWLINVIITSRSVFVTSIAILGADPLTFV